MFATYRLLSTQLVVIRVIESRMVDHGGDHQVDVDFQPQGEEERLLPVHIRPPPSEERPRGLGRWSGACLRQIREASAPAYPCSLHPQYSLTVTSELETYF